MARRRAYGDRAARGGFASYDEAVEAMRTLNRAPLPRVDLSGLSATDERGVCRRIHAHFDALDDVSAAARWRVNHQTANLCPGGHTKAARPCNPWDHNRLLMPDTRRFAYIALCVLDGQPEPQARARVDANPLRAFFPERDLARRAELAAAPVPF